MDKEQNAGWGTLIKYLFTQITLQDALKKKCNKNKVIYDLYNIMKIW